MSEQINHIDLHLSEETLMKYHQDALSDEEMHQVEKHIMDCEMCSDALDGFAMINDVKLLSQDIRDLKLQIKNKTAYRNRRRSKFIGLAAAISILIVSSILILNNSTSLVDGENLATRKEEVQKSNAPQPAESEEQNETISNIDSGPEEADQSEIEPIAEDKVYVDDKKDLAEDPQITKSRAQARPRSSASANVTKSANSEVPVTSQKKETVVVAGIQNEQKQALAEAVEIISEESEPMDFFEEDSDDLGAGFGDDFDDTELNEVAITSDVDDLVTGADEDSFFNGFDEDLEEETDDVSDTEDSEISIEKQVVDRNYGRYAFIKRDRATKQESARQSQSVVETEATGVERSKKSLGQPIDKVHDNVIEPRPKGGWRKYRKYLEQNLVFPEAAKEQGVNGKVVVNLYVEPNGDLTYFNVKDSLGYGCEAEAIRLIKEGPKWIPGRLDGTPTQLKTTVRVKFE